MMMQVMRMLKMETCSFVVRSPNMKSTIRIRRDMNAMVHPQNRVARSPRPDQRPAKLVILIASLSHEQGSIELDSKET